MTALSKYENMAPKWDAPVIIEAHINGARTKEMNPNLPMMHDELAADAIACLDAGAAAVHAHNTNYWLKGEAAADDYLKTWNKVFEKYPDAIMYGSTCAISELTADEHGLEHVEFIHNKLKEKDAGVNGSKLCVIDNGIMNLGRLIDENGYIKGITHGYSYDRLNAQVEMCRRCNMGIIFSVFEPGFMRLALHYEKMGLTPKGSSLDIYLMGDYGLLASVPANTTGMPATLESLYYYMYMMENTKMPWFVSIWGAGSEAEIPIMKRVIELGGHLKIGLEMHWDPVHKPTNVELLKQAQKIAKEVGRPIATRDDALKIYGLK